MEPVNTMNKYSTQTTNAFDNFIIEEELDFHGFGVIDHLDIERILNNFIEDCHIRGVKNILVITGKGDVIRPLVPKLLAKNRFVADYRPAGYFTGQEGAYEIVLND